MTARRNHPILNPMTRSRWLVLLCLPISGACAGAGTSARSALIAPKSLAPINVPVAINRAPIASPAVPVPGEIALAIESRLAELEQRGGACSVYASVMEQSYRQGRIVIRPFMWRVDGRLVSGQATPDGHMVLARDIDPLNVGLRTVDDVLWTVEHEAAHIAFRIPNDDWAGVDRANRYVRKCQGTAHAG